jgi:Glutamate decarboxylase and related PLP-dependent proteins
LLANSDNMENKERSLDPTNWDEFRKLAYLMVDDLVYYLQNIANEPVWKPIPEEAKSAMKLPLPENSTSAIDIYKTFKEHVLPYNTNNIHPRFWAWVQGGGTPIGMLADLLASGMNANVSIGEHMPMYVEGQVIDWCKQIMGYPESAHGLLTSGASIANITALITARNHFNRDIRNKGLGGIDEKLTVYGSSETHNCLIKGIETIGIGRNNFRQVPVTKDYIINIDALIKVIDEDLKSGFTPFCIIGNLGTVNTGAIDPISELVSIAHKYGIWLHIDGAIGSVLKFLPEYEHQLKDLQQADSISLDFHKWMYINYEVGCVLIKDREIYKKAFVTPANYLMHHDKGLSSGPDPFSNYGMELSRGFKALKVWMNFKHYGLNNYRALIRQNLNQAEYLISLIKGNTNLELLAGNLNIVCFRFNPQGQSQEFLNLLNKEILIQLQVKGIAAPSYTVLNGNYCIRVANTNHRSKKSDFGLLIDQTLDIGNKLMIKTNSITPVEAS